MGNTMAEFLFAQLVLLLATGLVALVGYLLKRHINTTDALGTKVEKLTTEVTRLLERDRTRRLSDYSTPVDENGS